MSDLSSKRPSAFLPAAGWIPWTGRSQLRVTGADRAKFLHNFCTNDIKKLEPGQGCEAFLTTIKGRILGHIFVFASASELWIDTVPGDDVRIQRHLDKYLITEDVQIEVVSGQFVCSYVFGSEAALRIREAFQVDVVQLPPCGHVERPVTGTDPALVFIRRMDLTIEPGFEIVVSRAAAPPSDVFFAGPDSQALQPELVSAPDFDAYRIDAGFPMFGVDLSEDHLAQEADRTEKAISFTKGCYLGQEPIARIDALGHVNRRLRVMKFDGAEDLAAPARVVDAGSGAELGTLTSAGRVPGSTTIALGMLRTAAALHAPVRAIGATGEFSGEVVASGTRSG